jgi:hypothetical protein
MNASIEQRFEEDKFSVSSRRYVKTPTNGNENNKGKKYRRGKNYAKDAEIERQNYIKKQQRKSDKIDYRRGQYSNKPAEIMAAIDALNEVKKQNHYANPKETAALINEALNEIKKYQTRDNASYVTTRRYEMPNDEDTHLENLHYANFLGDKYGDNNAPYQKSVVKTSFCDIMCEEEEPEVVVDEEAYQRALDEQSREDESYYAKVYDYYNQARIQQEEQERQEEEEYNAYMREVEQQNKNHFINCLMSQGSFDYDEAEKLVDYLIAEKYTKEFNDAHWLPWLVKFGITPRDLYGESYYC